ncbi:hypothetical protein ABV23_RS00910 [Escherichia coli]|nr:hypothetical protein [Escherichia coli]
MTTVYVDKRVGLLLTDSRVTTSTERYFLGLFPLKPKKQYGVVTQKSLYIHDRLFSAAGSVNEINKVLMYLIYGDIVLPSRKENCHCVLLSKDYCIHLGTKNGKFFKYLEFMHEEYVFFMGSGGEYMVDAAVHENQDTLLQKIFSTFKEVKNHDEYTDDNINVYQF